MGLEAVVVDYGIGNMFSVCRALEHCGVAPLVSSSPQKIARANYVILPGVGAFRDGMAQLSELGIDQALKEAVHNGANLLGICLGMQLLLSSSDEFGITPGLGLIPGRVCAVPSVTEDGVQLKIPHIGWNSLVHAEGKPSWVNTPMDSLPIGASMYFVHSFMAIPDNPAHQLADCIYGRTRVAAVVRNERVWGAQFHPEKSGEVGLVFLRRFFEMR